MKKFFAVCSKGAEEAVAIELKRLGAAAIEPQVGGVLFAGSQETLYRANLELRSASRILVQLREFASVHKEMLYDQVGRIHWEEVLTPETTFAVETVMSRSHLAGKQGQGPKLHHSNFVSLKIKDAIVDRMRYKFGARPNVDRENPMVRVHAYLNENRCLISLDSSGSSLHERGYREKTTGAPLKESLASAILEYAGFDGKRPFLDPMCGSGTLAIEAALRAMNVAPGLFRSQFGFEGFRDFDAALFARLKREAEARILKKPEIEIFASDYDERALEALRRNAKGAGVLKWIDVDKRSIRHVLPRVSQGGLLVCNPPYGERLSSIDTLKGLYKDMGDSLKQNFKSWDAWIFSGNRELLKSVGLRTSKKIILFNGPLECRLVHYQLY